MGNLALLPLAPWGVAVPPPGRWKGGRESCRTKGGGVAAAGETVVPTWGRAVRPRAREGGRSRLWGSIGGLWLCWGYLLP